MNRLYSWAETHPVYGRYFGFSFAAPTLDRYGDTKCHDHAVYLYANEPEGWDAEQMRWLFWKKKRPRCRGRS
jgi:hypothetical protein